MKVGSHLNRLPEGVFYDIVVNRARVGHWDGGVFKVGEIGDSRFELYFNLKWLNWGPWDSRLETLKEYTSSHIVQDVKLHICHDSRMVSGAENSLHYHSFPHACTETELTLIQHVRDQCRSAGVPFSIENVCPQIRDIVEGSTKVTFPDGPTICDHELLRDRTYCPCCTGDCGYPPIGRDAVPGYKSDSPFRGA